MKMVDKSLKQDLIAHNIYSSWQFIEYTEKNIATVHYCAETINNIISKMTMKTVDYSQVSGHAFRKNLSRSRCLGPLPV